MHVTAIGDMTAMRFAHLYSVKGHPVMSLLPSIRHAKESWLRKVLANDLHPHGQKGSVAFERLQATDGEGQSGQSGLMREPEHIVRHLRG